MASVLLDQPYCEQAHNEPTYPDVPQCRPLSLGPLHPIVYAQANYLEKCQNPPKNVVQLLSISYPEILSWRRNAISYCTEKESHILDSSMSSLTSFRTECSQTPWPTDKHKQKLRKFVGVTKGTILFVTVFHEDTNVILFMDTFESKKLREGDISKSTNKNDNHAEVVLKNSESAIKAKIKAKLNVLKPASTKIKINIQIKNSPCNDCALTLVNFVNYLENSSDGGPLIIGLGGISLNYIQIYKGQREGLDLLQKDGRFKLDKCMDHSVQLFGAVVQWEALSPSYNDSETLTVSILPLCQSVERLCSATVLNAFMCTFGGLAGRLSAEEIAQTKTTEEKIQEFLSCV